MIDMISGKALGIVLKPSCVWRLQRSAGFSSGQRRDRSSSCRCRIFLGGLGTRAMELTSTVKSELAQLRGHAVVF
jgi:hypothetical protein